MLIVEYWTDGPLLKDAFERAPKTVVSPEAGYIDDETSHYIFWAEGGDFDAFEAGIDVDPTVTDLRTLTDLETRRLYRVASTEQGHESALPVWRDLDLVLLDAEGTREGWTFQMRIPDRQTLAEYRDFHRNRERPFDVRMIYHEDESPDDGASLLTAPQREALVAAYEAGHFDLPQKASQADVAARVGVSPQALSERLQRGIRTLVESTVIET